MWTEKPIMPYVRLGNSGLKVSKIILGCVSYGTPQWRGWVLPEDEAISHIKTTYDIGINTFDTANSYSNGLSEVILGKAIKQHDLPRDEIVVMTKVFFAVGNPESTDWNPTSTDERRCANQHGLSRKHIFDSVKKSLERLQLDYIDVLQCHRFDSETPIEEAMQALHDVVKAGYVRYIGMSPCYTWQFAAMQNYAINNKLTPFISMQIHHNLIYREEEREMFPMLKYFGVGAVACSPIARGLLCRPLWMTNEMAGNDPFAKLYQIHSPSTQAIINAIEQIANERGVAMAQISLAWAMNKSGISACIVGTTSLQSFSDLIGAVHVHLTDEEVRQLEEAYHPVHVLSVY